MTTKWKKWRYKNYINKGDPSPPLEKVNVGDELSITLNASETFDKLNEYIRHYIYFLKYYITPYMEVMELYPELSPKGRLHYHGTVKFTDPKMMIGWYLVGQHIVGMNIKLDIITDNKKWQEYIQKQSKQMKPYCVPYKITQQVVDISDPQPETTREQLKRGPYEKCDLDYGLESEEENVKT